jgi:hypothetical protein
MQRNLEMFGPEAIARAKRVVKIRSVRDIHTKEPGEIVQVLPGGWVKVKFDNAIHPALVKRSEIQLLRKKRRNPAQPFFCADCDRELKGNAHVMADSRVVCASCAERARKLRQSKAQQRLFDEQKPLFENPLRVLRNVEMGFVDGLGVFHPIRASRDYNEFLTTDVASPAERRARALKHDARKMREWYAGEEKRESKRFAKRHKSLSQWVRGIGGIAPHPKHDVHAGEMEALRSRGRTKKFGTSGLINKSNTLGGRRASPEYVMDAANVEGFRDRDGRRFDNIGAFLSAVSDDLGGSRKYFTQEAYSNPVKKKNSKSKGQRAKKRIPNPASKIARAAKKNLFGLGKQAAKKRKAKKKYKAATLRARAEYIESNPLPGMKPLLIRGRYVHALITKKPGQKFVGQILSSDGKGRHYVSERSLRFDKTFMTLQGAKTWARRRIAEFTRAGDIKKNPMHPLEVGSHLATIIMGAHTARELVRKPAKQRRPTPRQAGKRLAQHRHHPKRKNGLIDAAAGLQAAEFLDKEIGGALKKRKKNAGSSRPPSPSVARIYSEFRGKENSGRVLNTYTPAGSPKDAAVLGRINHVLLADGRKVIFRRNPALLLGAQRGNSRRLYIGLKRPFAMPNGVKNGAAFNYGEVKEVDYNADKPHLYKTPVVIRFYHQLGEEGGKRPQLILQNGVLALRGGDYTIAREGIRN